MSGCQRCNSGCQYCNSCEKCDSCEQCNTACDGGGCLTIQSFCATSGQSAGGFSFGQSVAGEEFFLTKKNWNKIFTYINDAYAKGSASPSNKAQSGTGASAPGNGGDSGLPASDEHEFMTDTMFNKVSEALGNLGSSGPSRRVKADVDLIYGSYFKDLESYANGLQYKTTQCDDCNVACNVKCNTCLKCNDNGNCDSCNNGCQSDTYRSCCSSCNTCQCSGQSNQTTTKT